jgi:hypothetical protein
MAEMTLPFRRLYGSLNLGIFHSVKPVVSLRITTESRYVPSDSVKSHLPSSRILLIRRSRLDVTIGFGCTLSYV